MGKKITDEQIERIKKMTLGGCTQFHIAEDIGVSKGAVAYYQKKLNLKASNKWHFGESAFIEPVSVIEGPKDVQKKPRKWTSIVDQTIVLTGVSTNFSYTIGTNSDIIVIEPTYGPKIEIEMKDVCAFGNELIDIAERLNQTISNAE